MKYLLAATALLVAPVAGHAATFSFSNTNGAVSSVAATSGGVNVTLTGGTIDDDLSNFAGGASLFGGPTGLGVIGVSGSSSAASATTITASDARIDGIDVDENEVIRFVFDREVTVNSIDLGGIDGFDDIYFNIAGAPFVGANRFDDPAGDSSSEVDFTQTFAGLTGTEFFLIAGIPKPGTNAAPGGYNDSFSLVGIDATPVAPVPLPAGLPLLVGALGAMGWVARRKRS